MFTKYQDTLCTTDKASNSGLSKFEHTKQYCFSQKPNSTFIFFFFFFFVLCDSFVLQTLQVPFSEGIIFLNNGSLFCQRMSLVVTAITPVGELWTRHVFVFLGTSKSINSACK